MSNYQAAVDDFDREVARLLGVNETDLRCLEILIREESEPVTPRLLADRLGLTTGSVTAMLDRLERIGYLTRTAHPTDKRRLIVRATDTVRSRAFELLTPLIEDGEQVLRTHYSAAELDLFSEFLVRIAEVQTAHTRRLRDRTPFPRG
ncbi:MarR family winged helix-turn-helix transcriptional regulator [Kitasatospora sp. NPDC052896]|uniref:MarR family winged helix-turn-helix transcriptional regulator n=1 Tax=Kitasatospora sp. NPDC052896 TaxID=3364061 RepID=UPI0037C9C59E